MSSQKTTHVPIIHSIAPWKWTQHCWMLHFASVCTPCCMLLRAIGSSCEKFETGKTFSRNVRNNSQHFLHEAYYSTITQCCFVKIILSLHSFMNDPMLITWGRRANSWSRLQGGGRLLKWRKQKDENISWLLQSFSSSNYGTLLRKDWVNRPQTYHYQIILSRIHNLFAVTLVSRNWLLKKDRQIFENSTVQYRD